MTSFPFNFFSAIYDILIIDVMSKRKQNCLTFSITERELVDFYCLAIEGLCFFIDLFD